MLLEASSGRSGEYSTAQAFAAWADRTPGGPRRGPWSARHGAGARSTPTELTCCQRRLETSRRRMGSWVAASDHLAESRACVASGPSEPLGAGPNPTARGTRRDASRRPDRLIAVAHDNRPARTWTAHHRPQRSGNLAGSGPRASLAAGDHSDASSAIEMTCPDAVSHAAGRGGSTRALRRSRSVTTKRFALS